MLKVQEIKELIRAMDQSSLDEMKFEQEGTKIVLKKQVAEATTGQATAPTPVTEVKPAAPAKVEAAEQAPKPVAKETKEESNLHTITSPMVGTFYSSPSPDADAYVKTGDSVEEETVVCIVEAMKLMNEIEAEVTGKVVEVLAQNGELVEYGQPLFVVEPS
ncbi:acetyl-CoA carboxylase biotin carboxyl carrier protein [Alkalihalophilus lindianensis]|uniref:Biotin carboxyl carrier protein of acetyl-CoA carboxylase n=1 Tax=Alkalihalophilus lindianensis TaxID=1630542 RepID=A0ABU3XB83_9BACI|nr:acetyl-CoA carboxylase biotin carboxyl carrier protein [Alkalihalophilus lindianensis]MDV2685145.1 acetyl-CoA carboxylase biotin carboxyl carrier protein [Alkalihalophilus lindianensis]